MNDASSITMQMLSNHNMTAKDLEALYGRSLTAKELAKFLGLDTRTVKKYAYRWGGVEVSPGNWRFFENRIKEVLHAEYNNEAWQAPRSGDDMGRREVLGNVFRNDLEAIWNAGDALHEKQAAGEFPGPCADCDEYYTFNF